MAGIILCRGLKINNIRCLCLKGKIKQQHNTACKIPYNIQNNTEQGDTRQDGTTLYIHDTRQYSKIQNNTIPYNETQHKATQYKTTLHSTKQYNETQHNSIQYNTIQHSTKQHRAYEAQGSY